MIKASKLDEVVSLSLVEGLSEILRIINVSWSNFGLVASKSHFTVGWAVHTFNKNK